MANILSKAKYISPLIAGKDILGLPSASDDVSSLLSGGNSDRARAASEQAAGAIQGVNTPDVEQMKLHLQGLVQQGTITPEQAQAALQDPSALGGITLDPRAKQAQLAALSSLQDIGQNGMTAMDRAKLGQISTDEATQQRGAREAILQNAQQRGVGGSGAEQLSQMINEQQSAGRQNQRDLDVNAQAQQRALEALQNAGQLGGQINQQDFNQQAQVAQARDAINKFNATNNQQANMYNAQVGNAAQAQNLAEKQRVADQNTALQNQQQANNAQLTQQDFENKYKKAAGVANAYNSQANNYNQAGANFQNTLGTGAQAAAYAFSDENLKEDVKPFDADEFLDSLVPSKYKYKSKAMGKGAHAGVMAQDLEKTEVGKSLVENTPHGKIVNYGKGFGTLLASMASLHGKVKALEGKK